MIWSLFKRPSVPEITAQGAHERLQAGAIIVDVRELDEWQEGHIPGAVHIPLGSISSRANEIEPNGEVIMVCRSGNRSSRATSALQKAGYANVKNLSGGMIAWSESHLPVSRR